MGVTHSTAVQIGKKCCLYFSRGNSSWSNRLQRRQDIKAVLKGSVAGIYELQYGEGEVFEAVLPNDSTLHICIQFSMLHFQAKELVMLILCPHWLCIARVSRASSSEEHSLHLLPCKAEDGEETFGFMLCTGQREKECYAAT